MAEFKVTVWFTDGTYRNTVEASDSLRAYELALVDARMASDQGAFYGEIAAWDSVEVVG